jgi:hypothetical protein
LKDTPQSRPKSLFHWLTKSQLSQGYQTGLSPASLQRVYVDGTVEAIMQLGDFVQGKEISQRAIQGLVDCTILQLDSHLPC